jgi:hypothetical protein
MYLNTDSIGSMRLDWKARRVAALLSALAIVCTSANAQFGGFMPVEVYPTASVSGQSAPAIGDFNGDGVPDLAIVSMNSHTLIIMLGAADGSFALESALAAPGFPSDVESGDFNGDGVLDLAVLCGEQAPNIGVVRLFQGAGDGAFTEVASTPVGFATVALAVADFDNDGHLDLAVTDDATDPFGLTPDIVTIYPGLGGFQIGTGREYFTPPLPYDILAHDMNMDGFADLVVVSVNVANNLMAPGRVAVLTNNGAGEFVETANYNVGSFPDKLALADVNSDGAIDIFTVNGSSGDVSMVLSDGQGGFLPESRIVPMITGGGTTNSATAVALEDIDGDGDMDLVMATRLTNQSGPAGARVEVRVGAGDGSFQHFITYIAPDPHSALALRDINDDSSPDLISVYLTSGLGVQTNVTPMGAPGDFALLTPPDGASGLPIPGEGAFWSGTAAKLKWAPAAAFNRTYEVRVALDEAMNNVILQETGITGTEFTIPNGALDANTTYYWTVVASNPTGSTPSESGAFQFSTAFPADINGNGVVDLIGTRSVASLHPS